MHDMNRLSENFRRCASVLHNKILI